MNKFSNNELEAVKLYLIEQFNSRKSPIRYSMLDPNNYSYEFLDQAYIYLDAYDVYVGLKRNLDTVDTFQLNFINKGDVDESIKKTALIFDDILLKQKFIRERIEVKGYYLHFYLNEFEVDVDDHYFFPCNESLTNYITIILPYMNYSSGVNDVSITLRYWDHYRYFKNDKRFIPFDKSEMLEVINDLEKVKTRENNDPNQIDKLISIMSSYQEQGLDTIHELVEKLENEFDLKNKNK